MLSLPCWGFLFPLLSWSCTDVIIQIINPKYLICFQDCSNECASRLGALRLDPDVKPMEIFLMTRKRESTRHFPVGYMRKNSIGFGLFPLLLHENVLFFCWD